MKKYLSLFIFFNCFFYANAQLLTLSPNPAEISSDGTESILQPKAYLKNVSADTLRLYWKRTIIDKPREWDAAVCDQNSCYPPSRDICPDDSPMILAPGDSTNLYVQSKHNNTAGTASIQIAVYPVGFPDSILITGTYNFDLTLSSTHYIELTNTALYPNPSRDYFELQLPENEGKLELYSSAGILLKTFEIANNNSYNIADFAKGVYFLKWIRPDLKNVKAIKLVIGDW